MDRAAAPEVRRPGARAAARRREAALEARLTHPAFDPVRPWLERLGADRSLERLNRLSEEENLRTASGRPVRFVPPGSADPYYEIHLHESGRVQTREDNLHDLFNGLAWLAFPKTKALINALHAEEIPRENGRRGRRRDLLTLIDEGGVIVECADDELNSLLRGFEWKTLFWERRERVLQAMRLRVLGHATLEQALAPWPGIACKAIFVPPGEPVDEAVRAWLAALPRGASPRELPPVPIFGYPGWLPASAHAGFYDDGRYFRPFKGTRGTAAPFLQGLPRDGAR